MELSDVEGVGVWVSSAGCRVGADSADPGDQHEKDVLWDKFRLLYGELKSRISMVALSEILPMPQVSLER